MKHNTCHPRSETIYPSFKNQKKIDPMAYTKPDTRRFDEKKPAPMMVTVPTPVDITANLYKYTGSKTMMHQYAVTFTPEVLQKNIFAKFLQILDANKFSEVYAFDGISILVSQKKFADMTLTMPMREGELTCRIEYKHSYDGNDAGMMQCMEIVSRYYQKLYHLVDKKRMFTADSTTYDLGMGLLVAPGLVSTFKLNRDGFYVNLDAVFGVFYKNLSLVDMLTESNRNKRRDPLRDDMGSEFFGHFEKFIKGLKVLTTHREKEVAYKVHGLLLRPASAVTFEVDGVSQTVADYFAKTYKPLRYPHLPMVVIKRKEMLYFPMEVLKIAPMQKYSRKLDEFQTASMIKIAAKRPNDRFKLIIERAKALSALQNNFIGTFGMAFDNSMLKCKGTVLPPPKILFKNTGLKVSNGGWNLIGVEALNGVTIDDWCIFTFRSDSIVSQDSISSFTSIASRYGIHFNSRPRMTTVNSLNDFFNATKSKFNLVILPDKNAQRYEEVKRVAETYQSIVTQCMVASNIFKLTNPSFVSNLLLKINCKLGGRNWKIEAKLLADKPTLIMGLDVSHPGITDPDSPSILSIVGSLDYDFINYKTIIEQQERRTEIIANLKEYSKAILKAHFSSTKVKPQRIVIFRDGVGDSMFDAVYSTELESIVQACAELDPKYLPEINFIIAQKRHSIRFSYNDGNAVPGTVVDDIGHPEKFDFFLVSQNALQGTARPVRYVVVRNDSNFSKPDMHQLVYNLCHLYGRATKSVSVVPPIYYADLAAARGKCYLEKNNTGAVLMKPLCKDISKNLFYL